MRPSAGAESCTGKQRMLNAYRGVGSDRVAIAPEFWYYYPAKLLGLDMIQFAREVPFHKALQTTFETFDCDGWGIASPHLPNERVQTHSEERWLSEGRLQVRHETTTPKGNLTSAVLFDRLEPAWVTERPIKVLQRDLPAWQMVSMPDPDALDPDAMVRAWQEVGDSYLLEALVGVPFFDFYAGAREGGLEAAVFDLVEHEETLRALQTTYADYVVRLARRICERTPFEALFIGCSWSCNSLIGPRLWREWDKPIIAAVADEVHRHGRLLHVHAHGKCMETVADFAELAIDCVCPFERPPGGDVDGLAGLEKVASLLEGRTAMNGNVHTVETLIRGTPQDVREEVRQIWQAFGHTPRVIVGTGDQVGRETPEENLHAMIDEAKRLWTA